MSVDACYRRITVQGLAELQSDPQRIDVFFGLFADVDDENEYDEMRDAFEEHQAQLTARGRYLEISKDHQSLNFLLTGQAQGGSPPLGNVVEGGTLLGDIDVGYGPPRFLTPDEVRDAATALAGVTEDDIRARYDPAAMNAAQVYPASKNNIVWQERSLGPVVEVFHWVKSLFINAAQEGDAILFWYH